MAYRYRSTKSILEATLALIERPENWVRGVFARSKPGGHELRPQNPKATCFCLKGAMYRATHDLDQHIDAAYRAEDAVVAAIRVIDPTYTSVHVIEFNDKHGAKAERHAQIVAALQAAIRAA